MPAQPGSPSKRAHRASPRSRLVRQVCSAAHPLQLRGIICTVSHRDRWETTHDTCSSTVSTRSASSLVRNSSREVCRRVPIDDRGHGPPERNIWITKRSAGLVGPKPAWPSDGTADRFRGAHRWRSASARRSDATPSAPCGYTLLAIDLLADQRDGLLIDRRRIPGLDRAEIGFARLVSGTRTPAMRLEEIGR